MSSPTASEPGRFDRPIPRRVVIGGIGAGSLLALVACTTGASDGGTSDSSGASSSAAADPEATLAVSIPDGSVDVPPLTPLTVTATGGTLDEVAVTGADGAVIEGAIDPATATWSASAPVAYGTEYTVIATASNADGKSTQQQTSFTTLSPAAVAFPSIGPLDGTVAGIAMPVRVFFDQPIVDKKPIEQAMTVVSEPAQAGGWNWISDTEVHWRPQNFWQAGTKVTVNVHVFGVHGGNGVYGKESRTIGFSIGTDKRAVCDTQTHQLHCYENGALVKSMPISAGLETPGRYTKSGIHVVTEKRTEMTMDSTTYGLALDAGGYQTKVYWATRISNNGEFVHAAPWSIGDQGVRNVSHGCINASPDNAKWYQQWCQIGDPLEVTGSPVPLTIDDGDIFDWTIPWETWVQGSANT